MTGFLKWTCFALLAGVTAGFAPENRAYGYQANWNGSATGSTTPGTGSLAGRDVDAFSGYSTGLGWYTGAGSHILNSATGAFQGSATWTAASGDALKITYTGAIAPSGNPGYPYSFQGTLHVIGGTGRLAGATGQSTTWQGAFSGVPGQYFFTFAGTLKARDVAPKDDFSLVGAVGFSNLVNGVAPSALVPYLGVGSSPQLGYVLQTGSIENLTGLIPINPTTLMFLGKVGPNPTLPGTPSLHQIQTKRGDVDCTWTAIFTLKIVSAAGDAVFSGDGDFRVVGGTGSHTHATGRFRTVFATRTVAHGADQAIANVYQNGKVEH
jgi:hypothetical protein